MLLLLLQRRAAAMAQGDRWVARKGQGWTRSLKVGLYIKCYITTPVLSCINSSCFFCKCNLATDYCPLPLPRTDAWHCCLTHHRSHHPPELLFRHKSLIENGTHVREPTWFLRPICLLRSSSNCYAACCHRVRYIKQCKRPFYLFGLWLSSFKKTAAPSLLPSGPTPTVNCCILIFCHSTLPLSLCIYLSCLSVSRDISGGFIHQRLKALKERGRKGSKLPRPCTI